MRPVCPVLCPILCLCLALLLGGCLWQGDAIQTAPPAQEVDVLKTGDTLVITVAGEEELSGAFSVNGDGTVRMELLGAVPAAGLSLTALQEELRQRLAAGYFRNPQVRVERAANFSVAPPALRPSL
jgi:protein involved in polysaccharide export with SLBB domain